MDEEPRKKKEMLRSTLEAQNIYDSNYLIVCRVSIYQMCSFSRFCRRVSQVNNVYCNDTTAAAPSQQISLPFGEAIVCSIVVELTVHLQDKQGSFL
jgi:hypothetical protein